MNIRLFSTAIAACTFLASITVQAHPGKHDGDDEKAIPTTCAQLADKHNYTNDVSYPEVKELKARCDAEGKKNNTSHPADHTH